MSFPVLCFSAKQNDQRQQCVHNTTFVQEKYIVRVLIVLPVLRTR